MMALEGDHELAGTARVSKATGEGHEVTKAVGHHHGMVEDPFSPDAITVQEEVVTDVSRILKIKKVCHGHRTSKISDWQKIAY